MTATGNDIQHMLAVANRHPIHLGMAAFVTLAIALAVYRLIRTAARRKWCSGEKAGTLLAAAIATAVSAQGMWIFMQDTLHLAPVLRVMFFGFLETMTVTSAIRARTAQRVTGPAGADGIAMWVLTSLSGILSATEADNLGTLLIRLTAPLVAAWGWERSMALERRLRTGDTPRINWRLAPQRLLVRLRLADPDPVRTASDDAAQRSLIAVALAVDDARVLRATDHPSTRKIRRAQARLRRAMRRATADGGLIPTDGRDRRAVLLDHIAMLHSTAALVDMEIPNPWLSGGHEQSTEMSAAARSLSALIATGRRSRGPESGCIFGTVSVLAFQGTQAHFCEISVVDLLVVGSVVLSLTASRFIRIPLRTLVAGVVSGQFPSHVPFVDVLVPGSVSAGNPKPRTTCLGDLARDLCFHERCFALVSQVLENALPHPHFTRLALVSHRPRLIRCPTSVAYLVSQCSDHRARITVPHAFIEDDFSVLAIRIGATTDVVVTDRPAIIQDLTYVGTQCR
ncbi:hypothetical protein [Nocardia sp. alder85J]|uniref:hypothetical protein n=1 Tax=Nocardia sp. alder85J TaxID=2862949 RepID=UPI001CD61ED4|nr:hypothetical protein [Nocardia sp. alder85J]MCX4098019.1 hypothetical protein [Nocardia sp. alder85J]